MKKIYSFYILILSFLFVSSIYSQDTDIYKSFFNIEEKFYKNTIEQNDIKNLFQLSKSFSDTDVFLQYTKLYSLILYYQEGNLSYIEFEQKFNEFFNNIILEKEYLFMTAEQIRFFQELLLKKCIEKKLINPEIQKKYYEFINKQFVPQYNTLNNIREFEYFSEISAENYQMPIKTITGTSITVYNPSILEILGKAYIKKVENILKKNSDFEFIKSFQVQCLYEKYNFNKLFENYKKTTNEQIILLKAAALLKQKKYHTADKVLESFIGHRHNIRMRLYGLAIFSCINNIPDKYLKLFPFSRQDMERLPPDNKEFVRKYMCLYFMRLALNAENNGQIDMIFNKFYKEEIINKDKYLKLNTGDYFFRTRNYKMASKYFRELAIDSYPGARILYDLFQGIYGFYIDNQALGQ